MEPSQEYEGPSTLFDNISSHIRSLASLDVQEEMYGTLFVPCLDQQGSNWPELLVRRKVPESEWKLTTLLTTIEEEIIARERLNQSKPPRRSESKSLSTATILVTKDSPFGTTPCCYCNQQCRPTECTVVFWVDDINSYSGRQANAFPAYEGVTSAETVGHLTGVRPVKGNTTPAFAQPRMVRISEPGMPPTTSEPTTSNLNPSTPEFNPTSTLYADTSKPILLQTASAMVSNPHSSGKWAEYCISL